MSSLTGKLLIAMPSMPDPRFAHAVVFLCAQSEEGTMGLIINKPLPELTLGELARHLELDPGDDAADLAETDHEDDRPVHFGGPVETGRGFVLHSPEYFSEDGSVQISESLVLTTSRDIIVQMARGLGPARAITALGYAGWAPGQLEDEIREGGWLICDADDALVFATPDGDKWDRTLTKLGVDPRLLSGAPGHA